MLQYRNIAGRCHSLIYCAIIFETSFLGLLRCRNLVSATACIYCLLRLNETFTSVRIFTSEGVHEITLWVRYYRTFGNKGVLPNAGIYSTVCMDSQFKFPDEITDELGHSLITQTNLRFPGVNSGDPGLPPLLSSPPITRGKGV